ncbi:hypothetical protein ABT381_11370, partial [Streptomyces sp. NPDC000151]|uniref:hypothetical protein n=1 Tax=Streptomyces sp. NPDC000151 TaxID=3154244 RepID=UPI0033322C6E
MLEPIEPTESAEPANSRSDNSTPSDTLPPRRRRRAASRPAGPPVGGAAASGVTAAQPADAPGDAAAPQEPAAAA